MSGWRVRDCKILCLYSVEEDTIIFDDLGVETGWHNAVAMAVMIINEIQKIQANKEETKFRKSCVLKEPQKCYVGSFLRLSRW